MNVIGSGLIQFLVVLLLSGAPAADRPELLRIDRTGDAMGATYSIALYGYDRAKMEAATDAAFDEVGRLDALLSNCSSCSRPAPHTAGRAKGLSILRWAR